MAVTTYLRDREDAEDGTRGYNEREYVARGSDDVADIIAQGLVDIPGTLGALTLLPLMPERLGPDLWIITAKYGTPEDINSGTLTETLGWVYEYDTGETTVHMTHGIEGAEYAYKATGEPTPANLHGAINADGESVQGVDVGAPDGRLTRRGIFPSSSVSGAWLIAMQQNAFTTNVATWEGLAAGEALYRRTRVVDRLNGYVEITQDFSIGLNVTSATIFGITGIDKKAHDYIWVESVPRKDVTSGKLVQVAVAARTVQVYKPYDFSNLEPS